MVGQGVVEALAQADIKQSIDDANVGVEQSSLGQNRQVEGVVGSGHHQGVGLMRCLRPRGYLGDRSSPTTISPTTSGRGMVANAHYPRPLLPQEGENAKPCAPQAADNNLGLLGREQILWGQRGHGHGAATDTTTVVEVAAAEVL
jgi:hypothetical protein